MMLAVGVACDEQLRANVAEIGAVQPKLNVQSLAQFARPIGQEARMGHGATGAHAFLAEACLDGTDQHGFTVALGTTDGIDAIMVAVNEINIGMARRTKHDAVPLGFTAIAMTGRIIGQVSFGLDDDPAARAIERIANEPMAQEHRSNPFGAGGIEGARPRHKFRLGTCHSRILTHSISLFETPPPVTIQDARPNEVSQFW